jgi:DNA polymerase-3 subunit alpha
VPENRYNELHGHGEYSRLDGVGTAQQRAERAAEIGMKALALTDHGTLSGALHHIHACRQHKVIPISGVEAYFRPDRAKAKAEKNTKSWHLTVFAKNLKGWHNLLRLVSTAYAEVEDGGGFYDDPCVDFELLQRYREGLVVSTGCISSYLSEMTVKSENHAAADDYVTRMLNIFGDDLFFEIMPHDFDDQRAYNKIVVDYAQRYGSPVISTNDAHFVRKDQAELHRIVKLCGSGSSFKMAEEDKAAGKASYLSELNPTLYLPHEEEVRLWYSQNHPDLSEQIVDESITNTGYFISRFKPFLLDKSDKVPKVADDPQEVEDTLRVWIDEGMERLKASYEPGHWAVWNIDQYYERIEFEWTILKSKGVLDYFLLVADIVRWCKNDDPLPECAEHEVDKFPEHREEGFKKKPIRVGLGRGSAAGCLISYLIGIVAIDPIPYGLLFERFLNPERKGLPDIDLDFSGLQRHLVKEYIARKHGRDHVADIITHSTFQPKAVIQKLARVWDVPLHEVNAVTKPIDIRQDDEETTLEEILPLYPKLQDFKIRYPDLWKHAVALNDPAQIANAGKHAAGIVITPRPIVEYMALERGKKGDLVTSWSDASSFQVIGDYGFVKLDALGIVGLDKHDYACELILQNHGVDVDLYALPALHNPNAVDPEVMHGFQEGWTASVFQFGSKGIRRLIKQIAPDNILDITAANALYRPGPMKGGVTWDFPKRKHNPFMRVYQHPSLKEWLGETYGLIAYQEQVMAVFRGIGDGTPAEADDLRKAMGKLYRIKGGTAAKDFMAKYEERWFTGADKRQWARDTAEAVWEMFLEFGHYGFNKSHSASYALQAYQDMWLKVHYPLEFYAAALTFEDDKEKIEQILREARSRGFELIPPDVNRSAMGYSVSDGKLVLGLEAIKGIGGPSAKKIMAQRPYASFEDYALRCGEKCKELICSGAMDSLADRFHLLTKVTKVGSKTEQTWPVWEHIKHNKKLKTPRDVPEDGTEPSVREVQLLENEFLEAPIHADVLDPRLDGYLRDNIYEQDEVEEVDSGTYVIVGGRIKTVEKKTTKKGDPFANVVLRYEMNEWRLKLWSKQLTLFDSLLREGTTVIASGHKDEWNGFISIVVDNMELLETVVDLADEPEVDVQTQEGIA